MLPRLILSLADHVYRLQDATVEGLVDAPHTGKKNLKN